MGKFGIINTDKLKYLTRPTSFDDGISNGYK
jgi:hypothetical protein